jgi:uncharacterized protein (DUF1330 family)
MTRYVIAGLSMMVGAAFGGAAVEALHAQAKAPIYYVSEIDVTNPDAYAKEYAPQQQALIKAAGGRFAALGGAAGVGAKSITTLDGEPPKRVAIIVWPDAEKIKAWRADPKYQALRKIGDQYAKFRSFFVEGVAQ